jgi:hypothetical protein
MVALGSRGGWGMGGNNGQRFGKGLGFGLGFGLGVGVRLNLGFSFNRFFIGDNFEFIIRKEVVNLLFIHGHRLKCR